MSDSPVGGEPLRVVRVALWLRIGGIETQLSRILPRLEARGEVSSRVLLTREEGPLAAELRRAGIPVELHRLRGRIRPFEIRRMADRFREVGAHVVHAHARAPGTTATLAARRARVPVIAGVHNTGTIRHFRHRIQERLLARMRAAVVCVSDRVRRDYVAATGVPAHRVRVLYNGIDVGAIASLPREREAVRAEFGMPPDAILAVCPARLVPQKGHDLLVDAFARVASRHTRAHLLLAGEGPLAVPLAETIDAAGLRGRVVLAGPRRDVPRLLRAADLAVLASHREGFSNVVLEALAAGTPLVVTDVGGNREAMEGEATGRLVPPGDPDALARALDQLLADGDLRTRLGEAAARRAWRFDLDRIAAETETLYRDVLGRG